MRRLLVLTCLAGAGCAGDKGSWAEAMKDLRGENMEMRSGRPAPPAAAPPAARPRADAFPD